MSIVKFVQLYFDINELIKKLSSYDTLKQMSNSITTHYVAQYYIISVIHFK